MKKYRMFMGACGPHFMYTNIIKANTPEEAARKYLGENANDEEVAEIASRMREVSERTVREEGESFVDALGVDINIGKTIAFICRQEGNSIKEGKVVALKKSTIVVVSDNKEYRLISDTDDGRTIHKALVINKKKKKTNEASAVDAVGQPLKEGALVAYRKDIYGDTCKGFDLGRVTGLSAKYATIKDNERHVDVRRRHDYILMI